MKDEQVAMDGDRSKKSGEGGGMAHKDDGQCRTFKTEAKAGNSSILSTYYVADTVLSALDPFGYFILIRML